MSATEPTAPPPQLTNEEHEARRAEGVKMSQETKDRFAHEDVPFGSHPRQRMDLFFPEGEAKGPTLVFLHGGGFRAGDPGSVSYHGYHYLESGAIFAAMGYRLLPDAKVEDAADDIEAGLTALAERVADHGGDPEQIYLSGHSAGAILAASVGLRPSSAIPADLVKGLVLISGMYQAENSDPERYNPGSARHVSRLIDHVEHIPGHTIVVAGDHDFPACLPDATALTELLRARGGSVEMFVEPDADHFAANRSFVAASGPVHDATITMMKLS
ncbi:MAG: alpha/beta hydrolase [Acidimicrobiaceae bacterium]|nr:alpha/beta hydrolase [Acidimicrobiaceae bacterium]